MEIIKKNLLSILCGAVALVAIIASVWPMGSYQQTQRDTLTGRVSAFHTVDQLRSKGRNKPLLDPESTAPEPLGRFPNDATIEEADKAKKKFEAESKKILDNAVAMNKHDLLVPGSLPTPKNSSDVINFRFAYKDAIEQGIAKMIKAGTPPTLEQITAAQTKLKEEQFKPQVITAGGSGNQGAVDAAYAVEAAKVPDQERLRVATTSQCYMDVGALGSNQKVLTAPVPAAADVWFAQVGLWIYEDVAKAIVATNADSKSVMDSPVKHLLKISLGTPSSGTYVLPPTWQPGPIEGDANAAVPKAPEVSPTGRVCNPLYDVVAFEVVVNIEASKIPWFLRELENKRFMSVHAVDMTSIDSVAQQQLGYLYGDKPVAQLRLQCEEIMFRDWSHKFMPDIVAKDMRSTDSGAGGGGGGGAPGMPFNPGAMPGGGAPGGLRGSREMY